MMNKIFSIEKIVRIGLRITSFGHMIEVFCAMYEDAYITAYRQAIGSSCDWILEIDSGYSHLPKQIHRFFDKMIENYDCVFGSRFIDGGEYLNSPISRYLISKWGTILVFGASISIPNRFPFTKTSRELCCLTSFSPNLPHDQFFSKFLIQKPLCSKVHFLASLL